MHEGPLIGWPGSASKHAGCPLKLELCVNNTYIYILEYVYPNNCMGHNTYVKNLSAHLEFEFSEASCMLSADLTLLGSLSEMQISGPSPFCGAESWKPYFKPAPTQNV